MDAQTRTPVFVFQLLLLFVWLFWCRGEPCTSFLLICLLCAFFVVYCCSARRASAGGTNNGASITRCDNTSRGISFSEATIARPVPRSIARARSEKRVCGEIEHDHSLWIWTAVWDDNERTNTTVVTIWRVARTCATHLRCDKSTRTLFGLLWQVCHVGRCQAKQPDTDSARLH